MAITRKAAVACIAGVIVQSITSLRARLDIIKDDGAASPEEERQVTKEGSIALRRIQSQEPLGRLNFFQACDESERGTRHVSIHLADDVPLKCFASGAMTGVVIHYRGEKVSVSAAEIWNALRDPAGNL